ncbi:RWD domain-containing protein 2B-like [Strongylocentrotus purpuratus]|uniref:RWD domain-containing protein n=1 Tax=Strongylocentrotus purpuratus TaxID=7668 RepID=A0A7M7SWE4_STRPU|nr:RWD domain-containing protein 2B-like [Strongylocentrotus purpuratus]|eukprot:XP_783392.2 PREDICTED: RWD domain-containing protein 2B-like [Strongylocentrotus purpuratus]
MASPNFIENLELQISEIELLDSMFPGDGEFCLDDPSVLSDVQTFVDKSAESTGVADQGISGNSASGKGGTGAIRQLSFSIKISINDQHNGIPNIDLDLQCCLPLDYPNVLPELNVQSNVLSRQQYRILNDDLMEHIESLDRGELCITEAVQWLQENASCYLKTAEVPSQGNVKEQSKKKQQPSSFTRLWIHSHHIYSRSKREDIFAWSKERGLTGFSLPGKPGIICVEGSQGDVDEIWHKLRRLNWKKLTSKHREDFALDADDTELFSTNFSRLRHFSDFQEINFAVRGSRDYHMDLGQFFQYLEKHDCADAFKILLGVDGRVSQKDTS